MKEKAIGNKAYQDKEDRQRLTFDLKRLMRNSVLKIAVTREIWAKLYSSLEHGGNGKQ